MKYYPKLKKYKASNLEYDIATESAYSYEWYILAKRIKGKMILNTYGYSPTTIKHYYKIRNLFDELGINYIEIEAPCGLQSLERAIEHYKHEIKELEILVNRPQSKSAKNKEREQLIKEYKDKILFIDDLIKGF